VAGGADHEQVAQPAVEDDLSGQAGVGAADDHRERVLPVGHRGPVPGVLVGVAGGAADEAPVAGDQLGVRAGWLAQRRGAVGGPLRARLSAGRSGMTHPRTSSRRI
jgi:hypothetical protein